MTSLININTINDKLAYINGAGVPVTDYKFSVTRTINQTIRRSRLYTKIEWDTTIFDTAFNFDTVKYQYNVPITGYYLFNLSVRSDGRLPGTYSTYGIKAALFVNNELTYEAFVSYNTVPSINFESCAQPTLSHVVHLSKNDIVDCRVYIDADTDNINIRCDKKYTFFSGHFLTI